MMEKETRRWEGDAVLSLVLRTGVIVSATLVFAGGFLYLTRFGHQQPQYGVFQEEASDLRSVMGIFRRAIGGSSRGMIQLGMLILIGTPIARVVTSLIIFIKERDRLYSAMTGVVLLILLVGLFAPIFR